MQNFTCKVCKKEQPIGDSVSLNSLICVNCFTSIQIHKWNTDKIEFYKKVLSESDQLTPIRSNKIRLVEKMNDIYSYLRLDILNMDEDEMKSYLMEIKQNSTIKALRLWKKNYIVREYDSKTFELDKMLKTVLSYREKINDGNRVKIKFQRFVDIIGKESNFKVIKDRMLNAINSFIEENNAEEYSKLHEFVHKGVSNIFEEELLPNVSLFLNNNYERIFSTLLTTVLPFNKTRLSSYDPYVNSRTDFRIKLFYRYNAVEIHLLQEAIKKYCDPPLKIELVTKLLFLNSIKSISKIIDDLFKYYYKKLKIYGDVALLINVLDAKQKVTQRYIEVTYHIHFREK